MKQHNTKNLEDAFGVNGNTKSTISLMKKLSPSQKQDIYDIYLHNISSFDKGHIVSIVRAYDEVINNEPSLTQIMEDSDGKALSLLHFKLQFKKIAFTYNLKAAKAASKFPYEASERIEYDLDFN